MNPSPEEALRSMYCLLGRYPSCRPGHAKGTLCRGMFTPAAAASQFTCAPHLQERSVDVTVRFSNVTGNPDHSDALHSVRGMATRFHLGDGTSTDLIAVTLPSFTNRTPGDFVRMNACLRNKLKLIPFLLQHRESWRAFWANWRMKLFPSYGNYRYNALNAFKWIDQQGIQHYVRLSWLPESPAGPIGREAAKQLSHDYLQEDLYQRLGRVPVEPIRFQLQVQLASQDDLLKGRVLDPTAPWPAGKGKIVTALAGDKQERFLIAGILELTGLEDGSRLPDDGTFHFDPCHVVDGIEPSDDQILRFRPAVYRRSFEDRLKVLPKDRTRC